MNLTIEQENEFGDTPSKLQNKSEVIPIRVVHSNEGIIHIYFIPDNTTLILSYFKNVVKINIDGSEFPDFAEMSNNKNLYMKLKKHKNQVQLNKNILMADIITKHFLRK